MDDLNRKRHAVYKLTYHAVFVIKYRRRVMTEPFGMRSKISSGRIASGQTVISLPLPEAQTLKH